RQNGVGGVLCRGGAPSLLSMGSGGRGRPVVAALTRVWGRASHYAALVLGGEADARTDRHGKRLPRVRYNTSYSR
ncbi:unnamed protein product, partial [Nesidiocoris tenuis]